MCDRLATVIRRFKSLDGCERVAHRLRSREGLATTQRVKAIAQVIYR